MLLKSPPLYWALLGSRDSWGHFKKGEPEVAKVLIDAGANIDDVMQMIADKGCFMECSSNPDKLEMIDEAYNISLKTLHAVGPINLVKFVDIALNSKKFPPDLRTNKVRRQLVKWFGRILKIEEKEILEILQSL